MENEKVFAMKFSKVYSLLVAKAERKGRTKQEVNRVITWLTGFDDAAIENLAASDIGYKAFFDSSPNLNPEWLSVKGTVCGIHVESIEDETMRKIRCLDKLIDELAKGKSLEKILNR